MFPQSYNTNKGIGRYLHAEQLVIKIILPTQYPMNIETENKTLT
jgi:hypothetical protein